MIGFRIDAAKSMFFDRQTVLDPFEKARLRVLSKAGAFIRQRFRSIVRPGKGASQPGQPPKSHQGDLRKYCYFGFDKVTKSVVVGPAQTNKVYFDGDGKPLTGPATEVLDKGGTIQILEFFKAGEWRRVNLSRRRRAAGFQTRLRRVAIQARPAIVPAMENELPKFPELWRNAIQR